MTAKTPIAEFESALSDFDPAVRADALDHLVRLAANGEIALPRAGDWINLHGHSFFSYNPDNHSPTEFAWRARRRGLAVAGLVDFDVLDGVDEFLAAADLLRLKAIASVESRVFVPEFADREINSPGEPGIAYHMGIAFPTAQVPPSASAFLQGMRASAERRNRELVARVNAFLAPLHLDYETDVTPLTPKGNATERHICAAYAAKASAQLPDLETLAAFWSSKLGPLPEQMDLPLGPKLQALIRAKTMKRGGPGYVQPTPDSFPLMADMNRFSLEAGAIPCLAWLDGTSPGERCMEELMDVASRSGVAAINIIPDRNYTPGVEDQKLANLRAVVALADGRGFPIIVGTELNSPGQKFVDDFASRELKPLLPTFQKGAFIAYAHSLLQGAAGLGYCSAWSRQHFSEVAAKNEFFHDFGKAYPTGNRQRLASATPDSTPDELLKLATA